MNRTRRRLVGLGLFSCLGDTVAFGSQADTRQNENLPGLRPSYLLPARWSEEDFRLVGLSASGSLLTSTPLPARGHGITTHIGRNLGAVFARRPGNYIAVFDLNTPEEVSLIPAARNRHFYGHGVFSRDGRFLYATENDYVNARGVIGVYDLDKKAERITEFRSGGVGPHDIQLLADADCLIVANGGIATHPSTGRKKLNVATMSPAVSLLDSKTGELVRRLTLPEEFHQVSLRHLAIDQHKVVWVAGQYEGGAVAGKPLLAKLVSPDSTELDPVFFSDTLIEQMKGYISSIAANHGTVAVTSSRGNVVVHVNSSAGEVAGLFSLQDCSGITRAIDEQEGGAYLVSGGTGNLARLIAVDEFHPELVLENVGHHPLAWDNHAYTISTPK